MRKANTRNYHRGEDWHRRHSYPGVCAGCGKEDEKRRLKALYVRHSNYDPLRVLCHLCPDCMGGLLGQLQIHPPE